MNGDSGLAVSSAGMIYGGYYGQISQYDSSGTFIRSFGNINQNGMITADIFGNVYGVSNSRINKYDSNGNFVLSFGSSFSNGYLATDAVGNIYSSSSFNMQSVINKYANNGDLLFQFGYAGTEGGLAVDQQGNVYSSSSTGIYQFSPSGDQVASFGRSYGDGALAASSVPEPASLSLLAFGGVVMALSRRR